MSAGLVFHANAAIFGVPGVPGVPGVSNDDAGRADQVQNLRHQRMLLRDLRDDIENARRGIPDENLGGTWRSPAQRGYARRRGELLDVVGLAGRRLDDAIEAVTFDIARLS